MPIGCCYVRGFFWEDLAVPIPISIICPIAMYEHHIVFSDSEVRWSICPFLSLFSSTTYSFWYLSHKSSGRCWILGHALNWLMGICPNCGANICPPVTKWPVSCARLSSINQMELRSRVYNLIVPVVIWSQALWMYVDHQPYTHHVYWMLRPLPAILRDAAQWKQWKVCCSKYA